MVSGSKSGFTLLEILVAVAILSISLVALLSAHNKALFMNAEAVEITEVVTLAREEMENMYMRASIESGLSDVRKRKDYPQYQWRTEVKETPFKGSREVIVRVFRAENEKAGDLFALRAYIRK
ncbi:hypothetical protein MNBD_NITROSPINAE03-874 [hydrothermal vent metagenome]|uniref:Type II secretion system protein GspI C-terminal domain-containing protein n=1 Tax=hydrothermal vent metagenome TaxID=652676 RepID=A0A3B1BX77_9ZZZZ